MARKSTQTQTPQVDRKIACDIVQALQSMMKTAPTVNSVANINKQKRESGQPFTIEEHVEKLVYSMLSKGVPWEGVIAKKDEIDKAFNYFDIKYLKNVDSAVLIDKIKNIDFRKRFYARQIPVLAEDIGILEKIAKDYGSIDIYFNSITPKEAVLSIGGTKGKYKLKEIGIALAAEYLKNMGIDVAKPDTHVCRLLHRLDLLDNYNGENLSERNVLDAMDICSQIAAANNNMSVIDVDSLLWSFCADGAFEFCGATPKCASGQQCTLRTLGLCHY